MPLHDWTRATDNVFHNFHVHWIVELGDALNSGLLPEGYLARAEEYLGPFPADVLALETGSGGTPPSLGGASGLVPTTTIAPAHLDVWRQRRIAIFSARDERRVAVIEVVSPGNKDSERRASQFRDKVLECLGSGLHVLLLDVLPATRPAPGFGAAVAETLGSPSAPREGRCVTSFEVQPQPPVVRVYHQPFALGAALPSAPLFLEVGRHVTVPLDDTYARSFARLPRVDRERLG